MSVFTKTDFFTFKRLSLNSKPSLVIWQGYKFQSIQGEKHPQKIISNSKFTKPIIFFPFDKLGIRSHKVIDFEPTTPRRG